MIINKGRFQKCNIPWNKDIKRPDMCGENNPSKRFEVREKIRQSKLGDKNSSKRPEVRIKISQTQIGKISPMKNKHHTEESKQKNREKHLGKEPWNKGLSHHLSEDSINKMSKSHIGLPPNKGCGTSKGAYYDSPLQCIIWLRSSYEIAYAKYLDKNHILWMYEMKTFELSDEMTYTPDFFLPQFEKFIDTKGYMRPEAQIKINKFKEEYPWDLEILYKQDLIKLGCKL